MDVSKIQEISSIDVFSNLPEGMRYILHVIHREGRISRTELARVCDMSMPTVSRSVKLMIENGYLLETVSGESCGGRKPIMLEMNGKYGYVIALNFECTNVEYAVYDFAGVCVFSNRIFVHRREYIDCLFRAIDSAVDVVASRYNRKPLCISIAAHGLLNEAAGIILRSVSFNWQNIPLRDIVEKRYGLRTFIQLNTQLVAYGEWNVGGYRKRGINSLSTLTIGHGLGCGTVMNGEVIRGRGAGGEIGMTLCGVRRPDGGYYMLEQLSSGQRFLELARLWWNDADNVYLRRRTGDDPSDLIDEDIISAIKSEDPFALRILNEIIPYIGIAVVQLIRMYDTGLIIINGVYSELGDQLLAPLKRWLKDNIEAIDYERQSIEITHMMQNACVSGAAYIAYDQMFGSAEIQEAEDSVEYAWQKK